MVKDGEQLLKRGVSTARERAVAGAKTTDRAVRRHPYQTIGIVFGIGLLLGLVGAGIIARGSGGDSDEEYND